MTLSTHALSALTQLDNGARLNVLSVVCRELIEAGMAFDDFGRLEITELGRKEIRKSFRNFGTTQDLADLSSIGDRNEPMWHTPVNSHPLHVRSQEHYDNLVEADQVKPTLAPLVTAIGLAWSRERAVKAAGAANGACGVWVDPAWVDAFIKAFENEP